MNAIRRAFGKKNSLPESDVARLLGLTLQEFGTITGAGLLVRSRYGGGPARYTMAAVLELLQLS